MRACVPHGLHQSLHGVHLQSQGRVQPAQVLPDHGHASRREGFKCSPLECSPRGLSVERLETMDSFLDARRWSPSYSSSWREPRGGRRTREADRQAKASELSQGPCFDVCSWRSQPGCGFGLLHARGKGNPLASIRRRRGRHGGNLESNMRHPISVLAVVLVETLEDRRVASRSRSPRAPRRRGPSQMWFDALNEAKQSLEAEGTTPRGRVPQRAREFMEQWRKENQSSAS